MKTKQNNILAIVSVLLLVLISAAGAFAMLAGGVEVNRPVFSIALGAVLIIIMCCVREKEERLSNAALFIYVAVVIVLIIQQFLGDIWYLYPKRYIYIFDVIVLNTSALLPLTYIYTAKMISRRSVVDYKSFWYVIMSVVIPMALVQFQDNITPVLIAYATVCVTIFIVKITKKTKVHWLVCLLPVVLVAAVLVWMFINYSYLNRRIEVILTRGANDPLGVGWMRRILDLIFTTTPLIGESHFSMTSFALQDTPVAEMLRYWSGHNIIIILAEYGWLAFGAVLALYGGFFAVLFRMVQKTRQSSFARYTSLMLALSLLMQSAYSLAGLFLFTHSPIDLPFIATSYSLNAVNYLCVGIIIALYISRNNYSPNAFLRMQIKKLLFSLPDKIELTRCVLEDGKKYVLVKKFEFNGTTYDCFAPLKDLSDYFFRKTVIEDGEECICGLDDEEEYRLVNSCFLNQLAEDIKKI